MSRVPYGESAQNKSISIRPIKILEVFENDASTILGFNLSETVSTLIIYFIKNKGNKKFIDELRKIKKSIDMRNVDINPSF